MYGDKTTYKLTKSLLVGTNHGTSEDTKIQMCYFKLVTSLLKIYRYSTIIIKDYIYFVSQYFSEYTSPFK